MFEAEKAVRQKKCMFAAEKSCSLKMMSEEVNSINHSDALFIDENMKEIPSSFPGSSSVKLTHDFYHVDSDNSDDVYTNLMRS